MIRQYKLSTVTICDACERQEEVFPAEAPRGSCGLVQTLPGLAVTLTTCHACMRRCCRFCKSAKLPKCAECIRDEREELNGGR